MDHLLLDVLRKVDTPTVCNAIEVAQGGRGFNAFTRGTMLCSDPDGGAMVGYARTARIRALAPPDRGTADVIKARRMGLLRIYVPRPAPGGLRDRRPGLSQMQSAPIWGEINTNVHKAFGLSGALTNGVMRDLGDLPDGFPVVAGSIGPSHGFVHVVGFRCPGHRSSALTVAPGALVHADRHGAVVVPDDVIPKLHGAIDTLIKSEQIVFRRGQGLLHQFCRIPNRLGRV